MTTEPQAQTSERERQQWVDHLDEGRLSKWSDMRTVADMLRADAEKIRALEADTESAGELIVWLRGQLADAQADAARYRWLTAEPGDGWTYYDYRGGDLPEDFRGHWVLLGPVTDDRSLNAAIDAALAAAQSPRSEAGEDK